MKPCNLGVNHVWERKKMVKNEKSRIIYSPIPSFVKTKKEEVDWLPYD